MDGGALVLRMRLVVVGLVLAAGCGSDHVSSGLSNTGAAGDPTVGSGQPTGAGGGGGTPAPPETAGCADIFSPDTLRAYAIDIAPEQWAALTADFMNVQAVLAGTPPDTYRPIVFHYGNETVSNAAVRLKGQSSWVDTVSFDANPKMQFQVAFDQIDPDGSFHGLSKLDFDMPRADFTFLNERLADSWLRKIGIPAPCASSGTLTINGAFYGLYVTLQNKGSKFLKHFFPGNADGDFLKGGSLPSGNGQANWARKAQFWAVHDMASLGQIVDVPSSLLEWAAEALLNDSDGYYGGSHNFYLYDQGAAGYVFVPTDKDTTLEWMSLFDYRLGIRQHPIFWWAGRAFPQAPGQHYLVVMNDPAGRAQYVDAIAAQLAKWDVAELQSRIDAWSQQVAAAVDADPHKWATTAEFHMAVEAARKMVVERPEYLKTFVSCARGMPADDKDGDGVVWCNDCADNNPAVHPGAGEACGNYVDDDCDGVVDEDCPGEAPGYPGQPRP